MVKNKKGSNILSELIDFKKNSLFAATFINFVTIILLFLFMVSKGVFITDILLTLFAISESIILLCSIVKMNIPVALCCCVLINTGICIQSIIDIENSSKILNESILYLTLGIIAAVIYFLIASKSSFLTENKKLIYFFCGFIAFITVAMTVLLLLSKEHNGAHSWLKIGGFAIQLTEIFKPMFMVSMTVIYSSVLENKEKYLISAVLTALFVVCLFSVNELGTALIIGLSFLVLFYLLCDDIRYILLLVLVGVVGIIAVSLICWISNLIVSEYAINGNGFGKVIVLLSKVFTKVKGRFTDWLSPDPFSQTGIAKKAIMIGGLFGADLEITIPVQKYDYFLSAIILRGGIIMGFIIVALYSYIFVHSIVKLADHDNNFMELSALSSIIIFISSAIIPIFVNTLFIPAAGVVLPFLALGAASNTINTLFIAIVLFNGRKGHLSNTKLIHVDLEREKESEK